ncbi:MAG TPA: hypothetical protein DDX91_07575 [Ruminococcaceae bacterium]|nr:hypothetical protein [Oscillospiraceae bacterium]
MLFFKKTKKAENKEENKLAAEAKQLPNTKKVQFCYIKPKELEQQLTENIESVLTLEPVNYYAEKSRFFQCIFFFNEDYSNIIMRFELFENDRKTYGGEYRRISGELYARILLKFGQRIQIT